MRATVLCLRGVYDYQYFQFFRCGLLVACLVALRYLDIGVFLRGLRARQRLRRAPYRRRSGRPCERSVERLHCQPLALRSASLVIITLLLFNSLQEQCTLYRATTVGEAVTYGRI
jgi:hypothetical protein